MSLMRPYVPQVSILVLGAGPTGLGASTRLQQHGHTDWLLLDQVRARRGAALQVARGTRRIASLQQHRQHDAQLLAPSSSARWQERKLRLAARVPRARLGARPRNAHGPARARAAGRKPHLP